MKWQVLCLVKMLIEDLADELHLFVVPPSSSQGYRKVLFPFRRAVPLPYCLLCNKNKITRQEREILNSNTFIKQYIVS